MKKFLFFTLLLFSLHIGFSQVYIPMPADSAIWRYRIYNPDYVTQVFDMILFVNGTDTFANGKTYHKIFSRSRIYTVPIDSIPPVVSVIATYGDTYYGAMRDSGQKVFLLSGSGEQLMFDFNVAAGDSIPAFYGKDKVVTIDSILLAGNYHRRFLTNDSTYYVIEGVGSNRGLIPTLNDRGGTVQFFCYTDTPVVYTPDSTIACTYVYPVWYESVPVIVSNEKLIIDISPVPAYDVLHITTSANEPLLVVIYNSVGQVVWSGNVLHKLDIPVLSWSKGIYYIQSKVPGSEIAMKKLLVE